MTLDGVFSFIMTCLASSNKWTVCLSTL